MDDIEKFLNMTQDEQTVFIESLLVELWENGEIELTGFNSAGEPMFSLPKNNAKR
jgi:hypothetical protein